MLIRIDSYLGDKLIFGKRCTKKELRKKFDKVIEAVETEEFTTLFCSMFQFEELSIDEDIRVDYVIDLDTHLVYAPHY